MADFLFLFRGGDPREAGLSPQQMQQYFQKWRDWSDGLRQRGVYQGGHPLRRDVGQILGPDGVESDGPFAESKEVIGGYIAIETDDFDRALDIARGCPIFEIRGRVEVRQLPTPDHSESCSSDRDP